MGPYDPREDLGFYSKRKRVSSTEGLRDERPGFLLGAAHVGALCRAQVQIAASQRQAGVR